MPETRRCACGCAKPLPEELRADAIYLNDTHGRRARRGRAERRNTPGTPESFWAGIRRFRPDGRFHGGWTPRTTCSPA